MTINKALVFLLCFQECDTCKAKPGTPPLCAGCLENRETIHILKAELIAALEVIERDATSASSYTFHTGAP